MANATLQLQGNYHGIAPFLHSPLWAAKQAGYEVAYVQATNVSEGTLGYADALSIAGEADAVIFIGGIDNSVESESQVSFSI